MWIMFEEFLSSIYAERYARYLIVRTFLEPVTLEKDISDKPN